jgi:hypothetical protein
MAGLPQGTHDATPLSRALAHRKDAWRYLVRDGYGNVAKALPQLSHRNACIAGRMSVRGKECVSLIFFPHFSHRRSTSGGSTPSAAGSF